MIPRIVDIRSGERGRVLLALLALLMVVASYTVVKTVRDALFLARFGISELCLIAIGLAGLTGSIVAVYVRRTTGVPRPRLIGATNLLVAGTLVLIWVGLGHPRLANVLPWVLYICSSIFGVFTVMQFWLLANDLFDAREAKRLFSLVGAGAILGGVAGGLVSRLGVATVGTRSLLLVAAAMLLAEVGLVYLVWPLRREAESPQSGSDASRDGGLSAIRRSPYIRLLAGTVLLSTVATTLLGWQFLQIAKGHFAGCTDDMTAYLGSLSAVLSGASFLLQTLLTGWLLRRFGVGRALWGLPAALLGGALLVLTAAFVPGLGLLLAASVARVSEGVRFAVDRPSMELMWMPVPARLKEQGKAFVDTVVDRFGTGLAAVVWLVLAAAGLDAAGSVHWVGVAIVAVVLAWIYLLRRTRRGYVGAFRDVLALRTTDLGRVQVKLVDGEAQRMVTATLASDDPRELLFALYVLEDWPAELPDLRGLLEHPDPAVVQEALHVLRRRGDLAHRAAAASCVAHPREDVREAAIAYLYRTGPDEADPVVEALASSGGVDPVAVTVIKLGLPAYAQQATQAMRSALEQAVDDRRVHLLRLLGAAPAAAVAQLAAPYLVAGERRTVVAALFAAGRSRCTALTPQLVALLDDWRYRRPAREALRRIGEPAAAALAQRACDDAASSASRHAAVRLLGAVGGRGSAETLLKLARGADFDLGRRAMRALCRLALRTGYRPQEAQISALIEADLARVARDLSGLGRGSWTDLRLGQRPADLLGRTLAERVDHRVERIFLALALRYDEGDVRAAYRGLRSPLKSIRASGIELLDNVLAGELKQRLIPLLEGGGQGGAARLVRQGQGPTSKGRPAVLARALRDADPVVQAVAIWTVGVEQVGALGDELVRLGAAEGLLAALARRALAQLEAENWEEPKMGLTVIEKALKLQKVDVLQQASTEDLGHIAQIAVEVAIAAGGRLYREGDAPDALFVVVSGRVRLHRDEVEIALLGPGEAFGSWALVDEAPRVASATVAEDAILLRVGRDEFVELLADRVDIVQAVFRAMVARLRELAGVSSVDRRAGP